MIFEVKMSVHQVAYGSRASAHSICFKTESHYPMALIYTRCADPGDLRQSFHNSHGVKMIQSLTENQLQTIIDNGLSLNTDKTTETASMIFL